MTSKLDGESWREGRGGEEREGSKGRGGERGGGVHLC